MENLEKVVNDKSHLATTAGPQPPTTMTMADDSHHNYKYGIKGLNNNCIVRALWYFILICFCFYLLIIAPLIV